jgi:hypothetical protein
LGILAFCLIASGQGFWAEYAGADCGVSDGASSRKIEEEKKREEERRKESYPDAGEEESSFEECLGGIYGDSPYPGFPEIPDLEDAVDKLCRAARREIKSLINFPSGGYKLSRSYGRNAVKPWDGLLNEDIWNALW